MRRSRRREAEEAEEEEEGRGKRLFVNTKRVGCRSGTGSQSHE